jgi:hypothetical protein
VIGGVAYAAIYARIKRIIAGLSISHPLVLYRGATAWICEYG